MSTSENAITLEEQIDRWRSYLRRRQAIHSVDVAELEDHLREQITGLTEAGLANDEAFLIAVKRLGDLDSLSREFAREHSERLWKQLVAGPFDSGEPEARVRTDALIAFALAVAAAVLIKLPALFGLDIDEDNGFYVKNVTFFVLPLLTGYFAWKRRLGATTIRWLSVVFVAAAVLINLYPFARPGSTELLAALHLPILLWLVMGVAYAGARWKEVGGRMDFIRFTGEFFIYYVLIGLGGGVLMGSMALIFTSIDIDPEPFFESWLLPCGAIGAVVIASWLVEAKQSVIENMAPVLTRLFTPLFAAVLVTFLATLVVTGRGINIERDLLIGFDLLMVVVLALLLYSVSARDPQAPPGAFDILQVILVVSALLVDVVALAAIAGRITEFGFTPNRVAALGENIILLVNLGWSAALYVRFLRGKSAFSTIERWQTGYLPVYAAWAAVVVVIFPLIFGFS